MPETAPNADLHAQVSADIDRVCLLVPPLWELDSFVAVNPFLGFASRPVHEAARAVSDALDAQMLPSLGHYRGLWAQGGLGEREMVRVANTLGMHIDRLEAVMRGEVGAPVRPSGRVPTRAESIDAERGTRWEACTREAAATWCAVFATRRASGEVQATDGALFAGWLQDAAMDAALPAAGLRGFRAWVRRLPRDPGEAVVRMLDRMEIPAWDRQSYFYRLLGGVHGWASHFRRLAWPLDREDPGLVREVLAIRVCLDAAVAELAPRAGSARPHVNGTQLVEDERLRAALQDVVEDVHARALANTLAAPGARAQGRPAMQAAFCIDVRSELMRRHLESSAPGIETIGFAGFFGVALRWHGVGGSDERCPVLVRPAVNMHACTDACHGEHGSIMASMLRAPGAAFPAVETLGLGALAGLVRRALGAVRPQPRLDETQSLQGVVEQAMPLPARVETAASMLAGMAMRDRFARLVLLCGHQGRSENNPHAAGLDCGACGGHGGALNARVAVQLLNDPQVRQVLATRGLALPSDTVFVAGVHDTSTDEVRLLDIERVPASHAADLCNAREWLAVAGAATRRERATFMGLQPDAANLSRQLADRAGDWSQTRPEWALARNMAFVVARRSRTVGRNLQGRAFLHEYDAAQDTDLSVLSLILSAPMVVASWINLQYFASTVDNAVFGSGDKMLHNRVGNLGVVAGNGSDLRSGLPLQSVQAADGTPFHEPIRLQVFVEAPVSRIEAVLQSQPAVRDLVENGWVRLFALSPDGATVARRMPGLGWEPFVGEEATIEAGSAAFAS